jgi:hypothetical protein
MHTSCRFDRIITHNLSQAVLQHESNQCTQCTQLTSERVNNNKMLAASKCGKQQIFY